MPKIRLSKTEMVDVKAGDTFYHTPQFMQTFKEEEALVEKYREDETVPWRDVKKQYTVKPDSTDSEIKVDCKIIELTK